MIRIMTAEEPARTTLTVDGEISGKTVEPLESSCNQALLKGRPVRIYLRDVASIDERGRTLLRRLAGRGIDLAAEGVYTSYIVDGIQSAVPTGCFRFSAPSVGRSFGTK